MPGAFPYIAAPAGAFPAFLPASSAGFAHPIDVSGASPPPVKQPPRPVNSFLIFSNQFRKKLQEENKEMTNAQISRLLGEKWRSLSRDVKARYEEVARAVREDFILRHPEYRWNASHETKKKKGHGGSAAAQAPPPAPSFSSDAPQAPAQPQAADREEAEKEGSGAVAPEAGGPGRTPRDGESDGDATDGVASEREGGAGASGGEGGPAGAAAAGAACGQRGPSSEESDAAMAAARRARSFSADDVTAPPRASPRPGPGPAPAPPPAPAGRGRGEGGGGPPRVSIPDNPLPPPRAAIPNYDSRSGAPAPNPFSYLGAAAARFALYPVSLPGVLPPPSPAPSAPQSRSLSSASSASSSAAAAAAGAALAAAHHRRATAPSIQLPPPSDLHSSAAAAAHAAHAANRRATAADLYGFPFAHPGAYQYGLPPIFAPPQGPFFDAPSLPGGYERERDHERHAAGRSGSGAPRPLWASLGASSGPQQGPSSSRHGPAS
eukprot:tig00000025_g7951.t1